MWTKYSLDCRVSSSAIKWLPACSASCCADKLSKKISTTYAEDCELEGVLSVLACTQRLIDSNERVLTNLDDERKDYKAAIDELRSKQEQVMQGCRHQGGFGGFSPPPPDF